ncbi:MAG TPA: nuclear transport factor 2 family protein [Gemmataceae bacterium]|jgi:uncharacterized protein (TIGR02246 family)|nr:nuclear transport factor 2 family protein [Gemmataceae bacterium]
MDVPVKMTVGQEPQGEGTRADGQTPSVPKPDQADAAAAPLCERFLDVLEREERPLLSELHRLNERWNQAWLQEDAAGVERLMADDYLYVAPNGSVLDRQAILGIMRSPSYRLDRGTRSEVVGRALGPEAAVVRHRSQGAGSFEGTSFTDDHTCVMVCEQRAREWRIVMEQCSFSGK